jgi:hypothetical protein
MDAILSKSSQGSLLCKDKFRQRLEGMLGTMKMYRGCIFRQQAGMKVGVCCIGSKKEPRLE